MKKNSLFRRRGFTLVELLIVIAIIAVLAALGFAGIQTALKKSKTVQTLNLANNLNRAIQNFYDEYGSFPQETVLPTPITTATGAEGVQVLLVLLAQETATSPLNKRGIRFLEPTQAKGKKGGLEYNVGSTVPTAMFDAWGEPFYIAFDDDYNDEIENPYKNVADAGAALKNPEIIRGVKAVIYSAGADKKLGTADDVKTW